MKILLVISVLLTLDRGQAQTTTSCYCEPRDSVYEAMKNSDLVISGKVVATSLKREISVMATYIDSLGHEYSKFDNKIVNEFTVFVNRTYEGKMKSDTLILRTEPETDCGLIFDINRTYIFYLFSLGMSVFTDRYDFESRYPHFWTAVCTRTRLFDKKEEDEILRSGSR